MHNPILRTVAVTASWKPLTPVPLVGTVDISAPPANSGNVEFAADDGGETFFIPGETHTFKRLDLSGLRIRGTPGDQVTIIGGTWPE